MTKKVQTVENEVTNDLKQRIYCIYDSQLRVYHEPFVARESELTNILDMLVNNVSSKYWNNPSYYQLYKIGDFDSLTGSIDVSGTRDFICLLGDFVNEHKRKIQVLTQTLNFLPNGYFKMPDDFKRDIQEKIDSCIVDYCKEFVEGQISYDEANKVISNEVNDSD